ASDCAPRATAFNEILNLEERQLSGLEHTVGEERESWVGGWVHCIISTRCRAARQVGLRCRRGAWAASRVRLSRRRGHSAEFPRAILLSTFGRRNFGS